MKQDLNQIGPLLQNFFVEYLCNQKRVSPQTIASYRDTFRLLLEFIYDKHKIEPAAVSIKDLDVPVILAFLDHLEQSRRALSRRDVEPELEFTPGSACLGFAETLPASGFAIGVRSTEPE